MLTSERMFEVRIKGTFFSYGDDMEEVLEKVKEHIKELQKVSTLCRHPGTYTSLSVEDVEIKQLHERCF